MRKAFQPAGVVLAIAVLSLSACSRSSAPGGSAGTASSADYGYDFPAPKNAPWSEFRHDRRNTGRALIEAQYAGDKPWFYQTGKGVFSPPVIDGNGTIYIGSADRFFYALRKDGSLLWKFETGEIIDSGAALTKADPKLGTETVTFGSGDEYLYQLRTDNGKVVWKTKAKNATASTQLVNWWEGHVVHGKDGTFYAGNTGGAAYAINPDGSIKWQHAVGNSVWGIAAEADDGTTYWASLDPTANFFALDKTGAQKWAKIVLGFATSPPSIGSDGTVYASSFDGMLYAMDPATGLQKWTYQTGDHIYAGTALIDDDKGVTQKIILASTDGSVYCLDPSGALLWRYDTGDVIRSSPVVGSAPAAEKREIVYVGSSDGRLYAINADDGKRRWSFDTTAHSDPVLRDRNDLNASPALGTTGVVIAGEHGQVWYVPYDYCLQASDKRCSKDPGQTFADNVNTIYYVSPGGSTQQDGTEGNLVGLPLLTSRFVLRENGTTMDGRMVNALPTTSESLVTITPSLPFTADVSGDGHFMHIAPNGFAEPDTDYSVQVSAPYTGGVGAPGVVNAGYQFHTLPLGPALPLNVGADSVSAFNLARLALPLPSFIPSINQIGFDSYDWIVGTIDKTAPDANGRGNVLLWVIGALRDASGFPQVNSSGKFEFRFPLQGQYRNNDLLVSNKALTVTVSFGPVPTRLFQVSGRLGTDMVMEQPAVHVDIFCPEVPTYGVLLNLFKLCNNRQHMPVLGTYLTRAYPSAGKANQRPNNVSVSSFTMTPATALAAGSATARFAVSGSYKKAQHVMSILLTDAATGEPLPIDYLTNLTVTANAAGDVDTATLAIPSGTTMPAQVKGYVISDVFPLLTKTF